MKNMEENKCEKCGRINGQHFACCDETEFNSGTTKPIYLLRLNRRALELEDWDNDIFYINKYKCSNCSSVFYMGVSVKYCPFCQIEFQALLDISL